MVRMTGFVLFMMVLLHGAAVFAFNVVFEEGSHLPLYDGASSIAAADLDRDGIDDLVIATIEADRVSIRFTSWTPESIDLVIGFDQACYVVTGDINRDGWVDVVAGKRGSGDDDVRWWENPGTSGPWTEHAVSGTLFDQARAVDVGDLDEDGDLDILVAGIDAGTGYVSWFRNMDGAGTTWTMLNITNDLAGAHDVEMADINLDGRPDIIATGYDADVVRWFENDGSITGPGTWPEHDIATGFDGALCVETGDIDTDGDIDVVAGSWHADDIVVFRNQGDGSAWTETVVTEDIDGPYSIHLADTNRHWGLDMLVSARGADRVALYQQKPASFDFHEIDIDVDADGARSATLADLDGDGDLDVVAAAQYGDEIRIWHNTSLHWSVLFSNPNEISGQSFSVRDLEIADLNNDGYPDLVEARHSSGSSIDLVAWLNLPGIGFSGSPVTLDFDGALGVEVGDIDGDGDQDLVSVAVFDDQIGWFENDGSGTFSKHVISPFVAVEPAEIGDLDCDGDADIVAVSVSPEALSWWENTNGDGSTWLEHPIATPMTPRSVFVTDLVGDPAPDLIVRQLTGGAELWVVENGSCGTTWSGTQLGSMGFTNAVAADFDRDGDRDLAVTDQASDTVAVWLQQNTWQRHDLTTTLTEAWAIDAHDLDGDGDVDLATTGYATGDVSWWDNDGSGQSWTQVPVINVAGPAAVVIGDLRREYPPGLAIASSGEWSIQVFENRGGQTKFGVVPAAPATASAGDEVVVVAFDQVSNGRTGDADIELLQVYLELRDHEGASIPESEMLQLFNRVRLWHDVNSDRTLQPGVDVLLVDQIPDYYSFDDFRLKPYPGDQNPVIAGDGGGASFLATMVLNSDACSSPTNGFQVHLAEYLDFAVLYAEHSGRTAFTELPRMVEGTVIMIDQGDCLFTDGFEVGSTDAWSQTMP